MLVPSASRNSGCGRRRRAPARGVAEQAGNPSVQRGVQSDWRHVHGRSISSISVTTSSPSPALSPARPWFFSTGTVLLQSNTSRVFVPERFLCNEGALQVLSLWCGLIIWSTFVFVALHRT